MAKRILRVTKWLGMTPAAAVCSACGREFKVPIAVLSRLSEAQQSLQMQFDQHVCEPGGQPDANMKSNS